MLLNEEVDAAGPGYASDDGYFALAGINSYQTRHPGGSNVEFTDGHAKYYLNPNAVGQSLATGGGTMTCP